MQTKRIFAAVSVTAVLAGLTYFASSFKFDTIKIGQQPEAAALAVGAKDLSVACPGSALRLGGVTGLKVGKIDRFGSAKGLVATNTQFGESFQQLDLDSKVSSILSDGPATSFNGFSSVAGTKFTVIDPTKTAPQSSEVLSATQFEAIGDSVNGLAAAACVVPGNEQWLLGAQTSTGREALLVLENPSAIASTISLQIYTEGGLLSGSGLNGIAVPANTTTVIPLASLAPKAATMALHVTSRGGEIAAWVQQRATRGTQTGGIDFISNSQVEASTISIPGLNIVGSAEAAKLAVNNPDFEDLAPSLDVFVAGKKNAQLTIQIIGADDQSYGTVVTASATAGRVTQVKLPGLQDGNYSIVVDSDQPIRAQANFNRLSRTKKFDLAFALAVAPTSQPRLSVTAGTAKSKLNLVNAGNEVAMVTIEINRTKTSVLKVASHSSSVINLPQGSSVKVSSDQPVAASLVFDQDGLVSSVPMLDYQNLGQKISVVVR
ncbi:MAG: hypothetical protein RL556_88 [Actinomycetota bacterium]